MFWICLVYGKDMSGICLLYVIICLGYVRDNIYYVMICVGYVWDMSGIIYICIYMYIYIEYMHEKRLNPCI